MKTKLSNISEIPSNVVYEGYVWWSDEDKPQVLKNKTFDFSSNGQNPFIIEAWLYDAAKQQSYHVRHADQYYIYRYDLNDLPDSAEADNDTYLPHKLEGVNKCKFRRIWLPEKDPYCEDMEVLTQKAIVFVGFETVTS